MLLARLQFERAALEPLQAALRGLLLLGQRGLAPREHLLHARNLLAVVARELFGLDAQVVRALLGVKQRLLAPRVAFAFGLAHDGARLFLGTSQCLSREAAAIGEPIAADRGCSCESHEKVEDVGDQMGGHDD